MANEKSDLPEATGHRLEELERCRGKLPQRALIRSELAGELRPSAWRSRFHQRP